MKFFDWLSVFSTKPDWERILTPRAKQVLALSRRAGAEQQWKCVEMEHLLAGILRLNQGAAVAMLRSAGLEPADLRASLEHLHAKGVFPNDPLKIPYGPAVRPCLSLAWKEAKALRNDYCGTEHILLGLLRYGKGNVVEVLRSRGLTLERARELVRLIQEDEAKKSAS